MHLAKDIEKNVKNDIKTAKKIPRLPWWAVLGGMIGTLPIFWLFDHFGKLNIALPTLDGVAVLVFAITVKWKVRRHVWFWITMAAIVALHVLMILYVPWTTKRVPAMAIAGILSIDLCVMFVVLAVVENLVERSETPER